MRSFQFCLISCTLRTDGENYTAPDVAVSGGGDAAWNTFEIAQPTDSAQQLPDNLHGFYCLREQSLGKSLYAVKLMCYFSPP